MFTHDDTEHAHQIELSLFKKISTEIDVRSAIEKKSTDKNGILRKNGEKSISGVIFLNLGNGFEKSDPYICMLGQHSIAFSSEVIALKSTQDFGDVR